MLRLPGRDPYDRLLVRSDIHANLARLALQITRIMSAVTQEFMRGRRPDTRSKWREHGKKTSLRDASSVGLMP
jgi:hypothetical protein